MNITSRGQLLELIKGKGVETFTTQDSKSKKTKNTIIHCKDKRKFYRLVWGEVKAPEGIHHLWYNRYAEEVALDSSGELWLTKAEEKIKKEEMLDKMSKLNIASLESIENNLSFHTQKDNDKFKFVSGAVGKGKSTYVLIQIAEKLIEGESVLLLTDELASFEVNKKIVGLMVELHGKSEEEATNFLEKAKLSVDYNMDHKWSKEYISERIETEAVEGGGVDFVAIDGLKAVPSHNETAQAAFQKLKNEIEAKASKYDFEVLLSLQLNKPRILAN